MKHRRLTMAQKEELAGYGFISLWLVGFVAYAAIPFIFSIRLSLSKIVEFAGFKMQYAGWENYKKAFILDINFVPMFLETIRNTLLNTVIIIVGSLFFAILLNKKIRFKGFFRSAFFLPVLLGTGYIMQQLLGQIIDPDTLQVSGSAARGIKMPVEFLQYLGPAGMEVVKGFLDRLTVVLWKSGVQVLLFLAGLQGISSSLYEAAHCDGATEWEMFWDITLPMISPVVLLNMIYTIIDSFTDASNPVVNYILSINTTDLAYASAIGWLYFLFILVLVAVVFGSMQRFMYHAGQR